MAIAQTRQKFPLGQVVATSGALAALDKARQTVDELLLRHQSGDWGEVGVLDWEENELSVREGYRLLSAYTLALTGEKIWVITEADRSVTTLLLPDEY